MSCVTSNVGYKEPQGIDLLITFSILLWKSRRFSYTKNCTINNLKKCFFIVIVARTSDNYAGISAAFSFNQRKIVFTIVCSYCSTKSQFPFIPFTQKRPLLWKDQEGPVILPEVTLKNHEHVFFFFSFLNIIRGFSYKEEKHFTIQKKLKWNFLTKSQNFFAPYDVHITEKNNHCSQARGSN